MTGACSIKGWLPLALSSVFFSLFLLPASAATEAPNPTVKAVNLGGWLVVEGWITTPALFDGIPNKDLLDGTRVQFKLVTTGKYLAAENAGGTSVVANRSTASDWATFKLWRVTSTTFQFRVFNGQFMELGNGINVVATANTPGRGETFEIVKRSTEVVRIKAPNGRFLQAKTEAAVTADADSNDGSWGIDDPSVFLMNSFNPGLWTVTSNTFQFKVFNGQFIGLRGNGIDVVATANSPGSWETFEIVRRSTDVVRIMAPNGRFLQAKTEAAVTADADRNDGSWGNDDPSVFLMKSFGTPHGEYQLTNGYRPDIAPSGTSDGTQVQFKLVTTGKYLAAENGGGTSIVANRPTASGWETFKLWRVTPTTFQFKVFNGQFIGLGNGIDVVATANSPGRWETFEIVRRSTNEPNRVRIMAPNGRFLQAKTEAAVTADADGNGSWGNDDPSVFLMNSFGTPHEVYQLTNGSGPDRASSVMSDHWNSFIVEDDFRFMSQSGLNTVRIPVGWWIAHDPNPPAPFVGGSLAALDNAFTWAQKYGMRVIVDLHAPQTSQNGDEHSGTRDGTVEWGSTEGSIQQTVAVIDFLAQRYAKHPSLLALELLNEPRAPGVSIDSLKKYYQAGYDAVRRYTDTAYVIMSIRQSGNANEFISFAGSLSRTVLDVHYYNLFSDFFNGMTPQQNIDYIYRDRAADLSQLTTANGPLIFVGEWTAEWAVRGATKEEYQRFARAQLDVFGKTSFGWAYWTYKRALMNVDHWSLYSMINNGYISL